MTFNAVPITKTFASFTVHIPADRLDEWKYMLNMIEQKYAGYAQVKITKPFKARSTGKGSQCNHLHGHIQQIARETYHDMSEIKNYIKLECAEWPYHEVLGKMMPKSESELSSEQENAAIEFCHRLAAEQGIRLIENEEA